MSSNVQPINTPRGADTNPISQLGRVVVNGALDTKEIRRRKSQKDPLFPGPTDDKTFYAQRAEICIARTDVKNYKHQGNAEDAFFTTVVNGSFSMEEYNKNEQNLSIFKDKLLFVGILQNPIIRFDSNGRERTNAALNVGGLNDMLNTSEENIKPGDRIYWDLPDPRKVSQRQPERILYETKPYRPSLDKMTEKNLIQLLKKRNLFTDKSENSGPICDSARGLYGLIMGSAISSLHALADSGIISINVNAINNPHARVEASRQYRNLSQRSDILYALSKELGLIESSLGEEDDKIRTNNGHLGVNRSLQDTIIDSFVGTEDMLPFESNVTGMEDDQDQEINSMLLNNVFNMFGFVKHADDHVLRRIFGVAKSAAPPNERFDILIGSNHAI